MNSDCQIFCKSTIQPSAVNIFAVKSYNLSNKKIEYSNLMTADLISSNKRPKTFGLTFLSLDQKLFVFESGLNHHKIAGAKHSTNEK